ncbi:trypsin-like peptidase domain-containing protein [Mucilaginibacter sp. dw_454]|uniref:trypsin-like peptidase domain-containing protein n=1 Tax=Mucilaginibacter sp. dw_454 TaxID=2720079 RepID=UPI001BD676AB|nr:trypsin-like peptidase domain-containing protein [Mucilaginibacter sp. dw_454]
MTIVHQSFKIVKVIYRLTFAVALVLCVFYPQVSSAQKSQALKLQEQLSSVIKRVKPACVRMWGFDTLAQQRTSAQFSAVVIKDGYILTAAHVSAPGNTYQVMFPDGRVGIATALGKIELSEDKTRPDVALMKMVSIGDWPYAEMGNSAELKPNQPCLSISYPETLNQSPPTVRFGHITEPRVTRGFIKSTCMMEPGDSGGPLFNADGEVIGLHSAIEIPEADNYDVPVNSYKKYWAALNVAMVYHTLPEATNTMDEFSGKKQPAGTSLLQDMASFTGVGKSYQKSIMSISSVLQGRNQTIAGTLISLKGTSLEKALGSFVVISKSSMVGDTDITVAGKKATVIKRDKETDLVMLRPGVSFPGGIDLKRTSSGNIAEGTFLISPGIDTAAVVGILGSDRFDLPKVTGAGFLGATAQHASQPAKLYFVRAGSPAAKNDFRVGDIIAQLDGKPVENAAGFLDSMSTYWPGDIVTIKLKRGSEEFVKSIALTYPPQIKHDHPAENFAGGKSLRRDGFNSVYVYDAVLKADQCGGPVFDINGNFRGINIARFSRACTVILSVSDVIQFLNNSVDNTKPRS